MSNEASVIFDAPGPKARVRHRILTAVSVLLLLALAYWIYARFDALDQWNPELWTAFIEPEVWTAHILPGLLKTLQAAVIAAVLALLFGVVFGVARLSDHAWIRLPAGVVVEFFRAIPLVLMIFFIFFMQWGGVVVDAMTAVVIGLMLYNGSVLAEIFRSGILAVPKGQSEAAYALGLRKSGVMIHVLIPQTITSMLPAIISQLVILLKDTALGYIVAFEDLLNAGFRQIPPAHNNNVIQAAIVVAAIYIALNLTLSRLATFLEARQRRKGRPVVTVSRPAGGAAVGAVAVAAPTLAEPVSTVGDDTSG